MRNSRKSSEIKRLMAEAKAASRRAYVPYSRYPVGAALLTEKGKIITGCNIENSSYGATVCAERVAAYNAVSQGDKKIKMVAVFTETGKLPIPCGICRQVLWELAGDVEVVVKGGKKGKTFLLADLIPHPFR